MDMFLLHSQTVKSKIENFIDHYLEKNYIFGIFSTEKLKS